MKEADVIAYGKVIDLIHEDDVDHRKVSIALAKLSPQVFLALAGAGKVEGCRGINGDDAQLAIHRKLTHVARAFMNTGNLVSAIKEIRGLTGWGLKESKDYVDAIKLGQQGNIDVSGLIASPAFADVVGEVSQPEASGSDLRRALLESLADIIGDQPVVPAYKEQGTFS